MQSKNQEVRNISLFLFFVEVEKNKTGGRQHRNYSKNLIQRKTENEERMQSLSTGLHFNEIEFLFSDTSALNCKKRLLTQIKLMQYLWPHANENEQTLKRIPKMTKTRCKQICVVNSSMRGCVSHTYGKCKMGLFFQGHLRRFTVCYK